MIPIPTGRRRFAEAPPKAAGFTLIELMLAITIVVLVLGSISAALVTATKALTVGTESIELFQTSRAGMNRIVRDLRASLSPNSMPYEEQMQEELEELYQDPYYAEEPDEETLQITFRGSANEVEIVKREELIEEDGPSMDLREIRYRLGEENTVVKEIYRSLLTARLEDTLIQRLLFRYGEDAYIPFNETMGFIEDPKPQILCDGVEAIDFHYFDGYEWLRNWDSEEVLINEFAQDLEDEFLTEEAEEKRGLPQLVSVSMRLTNGTTLDTATDIPASSLNALWNGGDESSFAGSFREGRARLDRLREGARGRGFGGFRRSGGRPRF